MLQNKSNLPIIIIAIDGHGGSGKSTFIKKTAYEISKDDSYLVIYRNNHIIFEDSTLNNLIDNIKKIVMNKKLIIIYDSPSKENLKDSVENLLSNSSYKAEEAISFLEQKLAELKQQNAKLQK